MARGALVRFGKEQRVLFPKNQTHSLIISCISQYMSIQDFHWWILASAIRGRKPPIHLLADLDEAQARVQGICVFQRRVSKEQHVLLPMGLEYVLADPRHDLLRVPSPPVSVGDQSICACH
jgi:hypothetical protein